MSPFAFFKRRRPEIERCRALVLNCGPQPKAFSLTLGDVGSVLDEVLDVEWWTLADPDWVIPCILQLLLSR